MNNKILKPKDLASMLNVSVKTLQRWDNDGTLKAYRNPKGRRYYTIEQYNDVKGIHANENKVDKCIIYARVSNYSQKDDLKNQITFLQNFANAHGLIVGEVYKDIGSGLNYKRKNWNKLLYANDISKVIVSHKDRFVRFGFDWFSEFLKSKDVELIVVNNETLSPQEEMVQELISIIHVFSCRIYGLRKYKKEVENDESL